MKCMSHPAYMFFNRNHAGTVMPLNKLGIEKIKNQKGLLIGLLHMKV